VNIEDSSEFILSLNDFLSVRMKKYIHYYSMRNFIIHFDEIKNQFAKDEIESLMSDYVEKIKENDYDFQGPASFDLAKKYVFKISPYYKEYSNFMAFMGIQVSILFGLFGDTLLYFTKIPSKIYHIPIITICFVIYFLVVKIFKASKNRAYGIYF
jgi:hypothetical protein